MSDEHDADRAARLAEVDEWLADLEPGCDGWYIETSLVRWLRDEVERLQVIVAQLAAEIPDYQTSVALYEQARALLGEEDEAAYDG